MFPAAEAPIPASSSQPVRIGLAGAGPWGRNILRALARTEGVHLAAVASRNEQTPALAGSGCEVVAHWRELLERALDGVVVATPPASHLPIAAEFARRRIAVLIEKPMCMDIGEAEAFRDLVTANSACVLVDHIHLFSPAYRLLKQLSPCLGRIRSIASTGGRHGPFRTDTPPLWDWGPHDVSMILDLAGPAPLAIEGRRTLYDRTDQGVAELYEIEARFPGNIEAKAEFGNAMARTRRLEVTHEDGTLIYDDIAPTKLALRGDGRPVHDEIRAVIGSTDLSRPPLDCVVAAFRDAVCSGVTDPEPLDLAVGVTRVLDSVQRATASAGGAP